MGVRRGRLDSSLFHMLVLVCALSQVLFVGLVTGQTAQLSVDASSQNGRTIPDKMFGIFFEELNHAGAGGLWAELVSNRVQVTGFEAGGINTPSNIDPWLIIGDESNIIVETDRSSCFASNPIALRMEVLCGATGTNACPSGGVGIYNPGYWGMNIEKTKVYKVSMYIRSSDSVDLAVSLTSSDGLQNLATHTITAEKGDFAGWTKVEFDLQSSERNTNSRLQLTTTKNGIIWFDQVSVMPSDTYMGHGFRKDLATMLANLKPRFLKFPGGNYVMGNYLLNAFRWSETIGPWEERPGHFNDVWNYWTDDGLGFFEFLQLAEDLDACPVWVINDGASLNEQIPSATIAAFVKDVVDGIEFARGDPKTTWGSVRAAMGHPEPFPLYYISVGNQECSKPYYKEKYVKFYSAIKASYPDIKIISSCDISSISAVNPADLYDVHVIYYIAQSLPRQNLILIQEYLRFSPDAIVFNSWQHYGCPNYWMLHFFKDSSGATLHPLTIQVSNYDQLAASALTWQNSNDGNTYLKIKVVNFGNKAVNLNIAVAGLENGIQEFGSIKTVLTSGWLRDENSFQQPDKKQ
uniref:non-reducing end alpha-L-arabinofuranosidase n=1 Tax=Oryza barthii TaxID=65489 RepID=A0A0D3FHU4_9ORYZ